MKNFLRAGIVTGLGVAAYLAETLPASAIRFKRHAVVPLIRYHNLRYGV